LQIDQARTLAGIHFFEDLDAAARQPIEAQCRWRQVRAGQRIIDFGSDSRDIFFVLHGAVSVVNFSVSGREVAFATVEAGDCFGELAAIDGRPRSASVVAIKDSLIATMPAGAFLKILHEQVEVTFKVLEKLSHMVRAGDVRIMELSTLAATQRVYAEVLRMAVPDAAVPGLWVVRPLPPLREIASRVSTTRETTARALSQLSAIDLLRRKGRNLYLMDRAKLEEFVSALNFAQNGKPAH
jgi:CRP-like cAMP-binding protein